MPGDLRGVVSGKHHPKKHHTPHRDHFYLVGHNRGRSSGVSFTVQCTDFPQVFVLYRLATALRGLDFHWLGSRQRGRRGLERGQLLRNALVFLHVLFDHATGHEVLEFLVSPQT